MLRKTDLRLASQMVEGVDHAVRNCAPHSKYKYFASDVRRADADTSRVPAIGKKVMSDYRQLLDKLKDY